MSSLRHDNALEIYKTNEDDIPDKQSVVNVDLTEAQAKVNSGINEVLTQS